MKKLISLLLLTGSSIGLFAQKDTSNNYVNRFMTIPSFKINVLPDSTVYTNDQLIKSTPLIVMFFNPDCDHCQKETKELKDHRKELKGAQILMLSAAPYAALKEFYKLYKISSMSNVTMGRDVNAQLGSVYRLKTYPSIFVYDNRGILAKAFVGSIGIQAIIDAVK